MYLTTEHRIEFCMSARVPSLCDNLSTVIIIVVTEPDTGMVLVVFRFPHNSSHGFCSSFTIVHVMTLFTMLDKQASNLCYYSVRLNNVTSAPCL